MFVFSFGSGGRFCQCNFFCFSLDDTVSMEAELEFLRDQGETKPGDYMHIFLLRALVHQFLPPFYVNVFFKP